MHQSGMNQWLGRTLPLTVCLMSVRPTGAQAPAAPPEFEVASIKPNISGAGFVMIPPTVGGKFTATNVNLRTLVAIAYDMRSFQLSGGPEWASSDRYDVIAKADGNPDKERIALMLQSMLAERFQLRVHREAKELPGYALTVAKGGLKMKATQDSSCTPVLRSEAPAAPCGSFLIRANQLDGSKIDMKQLANILAMQRDLGRPVVDETRTAGEFDVHIGWVPFEGTGGSGGPGPEGAGGQPLSPDSSGSSIFTALREQLGLQLNAQRVLTEMLAIDHAEKPSEN
jgi:uncharacterized protein (TIGR03435 family)